MSADRRTDELFIEPATIDRRRNRCVMHEWSTAAGIFLHGKKMGCEGLFVTFANPAACLTGWRGLLEQRAGAMPDSEGEDGNCFHFYYCYHAEAERWVDRGKEKGRRRCDAVCERDGMMGCRGVWEWWCSVVFLRVRTIGSRSLPYPYLVLAYLNLT